MFIIQCPTCATNDCSSGQQLVSNRHIQSIHRTSEGMVGYVRCASGHTVLHRFAEAYPKPKPPASVVEFAKRQRPASAA